MRPLTHAVEPASSPTDGPRAFATTHWTLVVQAAEVGTAEGRSALEDLCRTYWPPLYTFARRHGLTPGDAEDLTQGFFADLLARGALAFADADRGRFRTFLLTSFRNYQSHQYARASCLKRGGGQTIVSLEALQAEEGRLRGEPCTAESPAQAFDQKWALHLIEGVLATVGREYAAAGKAMLFEALKTALWGGRGEVGYAEIARRLGSTEGAIKVAMHRLRGRFAECIRSEVAKTVRNPAEIDDEIRHLLAALSG